MPVDVKKFTVHLRRIALSNYGKGLCATHIRSALEAAGANTAGHPVSAKSYGHILKINGFRIVSKVSDDFREVKPGDIAVIEPPSSGKRYGHIQGWDGKNWISDFVQAGFWPGPAYRNEEPDYEIYRFL